MMEILMPNTFIKERSYIIDIVFEDFLGINISKTFVTGENYILKVDDKKKIIIKDNFFSKLLEGETYLSEKYLPKNVKRTKNQFIPDKDLPVIFGSNEWNVCADKITCGIDIFASSFFMLTRWEEYVNKDRDSHDRFPATASVAYKNNFLDRPIVNEYIEMLWNMLKYLGFNQERKNRKFQFINTHDVDHIRRWQSFSQVFRVMCGDILNRKNINLASSRIFEYLNIKLGRKKDPFDTFDWLMDVSEQANIKSYFFFMSGGVTKYDNSYDIGEKESLRIVNKIKKRNHNIGFHPSYDTYNNNSQWLREKAKLEQFLGKHVEEGRQHYLRFHAPYTWQIWDDNGMKKDYTLSFADREGFRCGTCYEFPVFNFLTRERLNLREAPLIVMEGSYTTYQDYTPEEMLLKSKELIDRVRKYKGKFVFLWHNSSFNSNTMFPSVYKSIIEYGKSMTD